MASSQLATPTAGKWEYQKKAPGFRETLKMVIRDVVLSVTLVLMTVHDGHGPARAWNPPPIKYSRGQNSDFAGFSVCDILYRF